MCTKTARFVCNVHMVGGFFSTISVLLDCRAQELFAVCTIETRRAQVGVNFLMLFVALRRVERERGFDFFICSRSVPETMGHLFLAPACGCPLGTRWELHLLEVERMMKKEVEMEAGVAREHAY